MATLKTPHVRMVIRNQNGDVLHVMEQQLRKNGQLCDTSRHYFSAAVLSGHIVTFYCDVREREIKMPVDQGAVDKK